MFKYRDYTILFNLLCTTFNKPVINFKISCRKINNKLYNCRNNNHYNNPLNNPLILPLLLNNNYNNLIYFNNGNKMIYNKLLFHLI